MLNKLKERYEHAFEEELLTEIARLGRYYKFNPDVIIMDIGDIVRFMPLMLSGSIKIMREDEDSNELLLYYLEVGDTCAMTLNCCLRQTKSQIRAVSEDYTELIMIPINKMEEWIIQYESWRSFVFESYNSRLNEMLEAIDNLAFHNMEERIYKYLVDKAIVSKNSSITITHYQIATELNTSREVVTRLLKKLAKDGKVILHRKKIEVLNSYI